MHRQTTMSTSTTKTRSSDEHRIHIPPESRIAAAAGSPDHSLHSPILNKEHSQPGKPDRLIHLIPLILILCFLFLWYLSRPVDLVNKNGSAEGVQVNETMPFVRDNTLVDFAMLKPVYTPQGPDPHNEVTPLSDDS